MDAIFGPQNFLNEIIWHYRKWPSGKYTFQRNHDVILFLREERQRVIERESAAIGVLLTLEPPTKLMLREAADAGFYKSPWKGGKHPRIQIITIAELLAGKAIDYPQTRATVTYKKAERFRRTFDKPKLPGTH
jgi:hypothetical protein